MWLILCSAIALSVCVFGQELSTVDASEAGYPYIFPMKFDDTGFAQVSENCTGQNKQKALYLEYEFDDPLKDAQPTDLSVAVEWVNVSDMRKYGANGVFAAQPFATDQGLGGYFGSQADGNVSNGGLLWSVWDKISHKTNLHGPQCPNATWCNALHSFPMSGSCHRHCLDCGLHPGWHNTTGTQCSLPLTIEDGDRFTFRLQRTVTNTSYTFPSEPAASWHIKYFGSVWRLEASYTKARSPSVTTTLQVGEMFLEETFGGVTRLGSFHEHIGCTDCSAFYESERRTGPWLTSPHARNVSSITFTRPSAECELFDVAINEKEKSALIETGPGCGPTFYTV
eukprot:m.127113 g.127113  ORF g.127113 m.127113 type:complete len:339 (+) comp29249_c0_seq2:167-1183(+)